jgi:LCP family protein required for cell wall assembly
MTRSPQSRAEGARRGRGSRRYSRGMMLTGWAAIGLAVLLVAATLFGYVKYRAVWDGINRVAVDDLGKRPPKYNNALNILLIGSDSRSGRNAKIGGYVPGQRSDTVMLVHISPGRSRIGVLSFPRDSVVPILACSPEPGFSGQAAQPGGGEQLNSTFANGGPGCLWKTLEQTTQIRIDDFVQVNFTGFISVINAVGGVEVCLPTAITPTSYDHLSLTPGKHFLKGYKALEFWRLREGFGLGSDLQRIQRDQLLMVGLVQRILSSGVLHSYTKTYSIIKAIVDAHALTTDTGLTPTKILSMATSMRGISRKSVQFVEIPTVTYPANPNWVVFDPAQTPALFSSVAHDVKLPKVVKSKKGKRGKASRSPRATLLSASKVNVEVLNGSGVNGIAGATATALTGRGFHVLGSNSATTATGAVDYSYTKSVVQYSSAADLPAARTVAAQLSGALVQQVSSVPAGTVNLVLGSDFTALAAQPSQPPGNLAAKYSGYTASTNVCKNYGTAFAGAGG